MRVLIPVYNRQVIRYRASSLTHNQVQAAMKTIRAITFLFMALFSALANAGCASGIWTSTEGSYLVLMEQTSSGAVVAFSVSPTLQTGAVLLGSRSGASISEVTYDVAAGAVQSLGGSTSSIGESLLSGNTVNLSFKGGSPATGANSVVTSTRTVLRADGSVELQAVLVGLRKANSNR